MDREREGLDRLARARREAITTTQEEYRQACLLKLRENISTKIKTTMIGSIAAVEEVFGFLIGMDPVPEFFTDEEAAMLSCKEVRTYMKECWGIMREHIMDLGNNQIHNANVELSQYDVTWKRYQYRLPMLNRGEN